LLKAISFDPSKGLAYYNLACYYALDKKFDDAEANLKKAIKTMPISTMDKIDLDNKVTYSIKSLDKKIHDKVSKKINNNELSKEQEAKLD